jgi:hypothetical protein
VTLKNRKIVKESFVGARAEPTEPSPPSQISIGTAFLYEHEMQVTGNFWNLALNINISNYGEMARAALRDMEELTQVNKLEFGIQGEIRNLQAMAREIVRKINSVESILMGRPRVERSILSIGGQMMKYLFGTALTADIASINTRVDAMDQNQEMLVHDVQNQITLSKI